ncbi:MAG TPA: hypothetical protein VFH17_05275 [Coriobacteriia bacterium]|nr:hypothetical protein [Coriobacteriia bacterium]
MEQQYRKVSVLVETAERAFRGVVHQPITPENLRFSDYLNTYPHAFICLTDVQVTERGQHYRVGDRQEFAAIAVAAICYIAPVPEPD